MVMMVLVSFGNTPPPIPDGITIEKSTDMKISVEQGQDIYDLAIQHKNSVQDVFEFIDLNLSKDFNIDTQLQPGSFVNVGETKKSFYNRDIYINSGETGIGLGITDTETPIYPDEGTGSTDTIEVTPVSTEETTIVTYNTDWHGAVFTIDLTPIDWESIPNPRVGKVDTAPMKPTLEMFETLTNDVPIPLGRHDWTVIDNANSYTIILSRKLKGYARLSWRE